MNDLKSIKGVEVFAAGKWNGDAYTTADLDEMVTAFNANKATFRPALKLGHAENQKLLQKDGYPAAGIVGNLYRVGEKLLADFVDMPAKIYELAKRKAYRKVSSEIFWNIDINGTKHKRMLSAVALLGGDMPAVTSLSDMLALYGVKNPDAVVVYANAPADSTIKTYTIDAPEANDMNEKLEAELKAEKEKREALEQQIAALQADAAEQKKFRQEAEARAVESAKQAEATKLDGLVSEMEKEGLASPAMKPYIRALIGEEVKEYSVGEKKLSKTDLVREVLKLHAAAEAVNMETRTQGGSGEGGAKDKDAALEAKIAKYAADHNVTYGTAYRAVLKTENQKG